MHICHVHRCHRVVTQLAACASTVQLAVFREFRRHNTGVQVQTLLHRNQVSAAWKLLHRVHHFLGIRRQIQLFHKNQVAARVPPEHNWLVCRSRVSVPNAESTSWTKTHFSRVVFFLSFGFVVASTLHTPAARVLLKTRSVMNRPTGATHSFRHTTDPSVAFSLMLPPRSVLPFEPPATTTTHCVFVFVFSFLSPFLLDSQLENHENTQNLFHARP